MGTGQPEHPAHMVTMLMRDQNRIKLFGFDTCCKKPAPDLSKTETAVDQHPGDASALPALNQQRVAVAAATQAREPHSARTE